jgi:hypothetical protein
MLFATLSGSITTYLLDICQKDMVEYLGNEAFSVSLFTFVGLGLLGSVPFVYKANNE